MSPLANASEPAYWDTGALRGGRCYSVRRAAAGWVWAANVAGIAAMVFSTRIASVAAAAIARVGVTGVAGMPRLVAMWFQADRPMIMPIGMPIARPMVVMVVVCQAMVARTWRRLNPRTLR